MITCKPSSNMIRVFSLLLCLFFHGTSLIAQDTLVSKIDSLPSTLIPVKQKKEKKSIKQFFKEGYPSPKKAVLLGILPGMGQIYNKKYWKLPLVYGALGGVIYSIKFNTDEFNLLQNSLDVRSNPACQNLTSDVPVECFDRFASIPINAVTSQRNAFDKRKQLSWIGVIAFYLISAGDAFVDAHLKDFSVDDDISFQPILETGFNNQPVMGIGITIPIGQ